MDPRFPEIAEHLLLIERELRVQGWWGDEMPSQAALSSLEPFSVDTLDFSQWLQWIFLPRMKQILENDQPLPGASGILAMAEVAYAGRAEPSRALRAALARFDELITQAG